MVKIYALLLASLFFAGAAVQNSQAACSMTDSTQQKGMMSPQCAQMMQTDQGKAFCYRPPCGMGPMNGCKIMRHRHACAMAMVLALLLCIVVNTLLTVLVILDMTKAKRFNGLWIPLTILIGIPGTMLYALFRIGDNLKAEEKK